MPDEWTRKGISSNAVKDGSGRFFHWHLKRWLYYDENDSGWYQEPNTAGPHHEVRRRQWRKEALAQEETRYYDCVEGQFYCYKKENNQWQKHEPAYEKLDGSYFDYG